jgi:ethanolamine utilization protein EutA
MALKPGLPLDGEMIDRAAVAAAIGTAIGLLEPQDSDQCEALCLRWQGSATYARLDAFCRGIIDGLEHYLDRGRPLVIVTETDIGGLIGMHCRKECGLENAVVSIDGIALSELDFIDIGEIIESSGAVPVVIKSLLFAAATRAATVNWLESTRTR